MFDDIPPGAVLVHGCNCEGKWGGGPRAIAPRFAEDYPDAFIVYKDHCKSHANNPEELLGTSLIIDARAPPPASPTARAKSIKNGSGSQDSPEATASDATHSVCCLFIRLTTIKNGRQTKKDIQGTIDSSRAAVEHMAQSLSTSTSSYSEIRMPKIGAGKFKVSWEDMLETLQSIRLPARDGQIEIFLYI